MLGESIETSAGDPTKAGQSKRCVGTNPFIMGPEIEEGLRLKEIEIELNVRIDEGKVKTKEGIPEEDEVRYADRTSFEVTLAPTSDNTKGRTSNNIGIKLKFEEQDNPEGIERIMDEFRNRPLLYALIDEEGNEEDIEEEEEIEEAPKRKNSLKKKNKKVVYDADEE